MVCVAVCVWVGAFLLFAIDDQCLISSERVCVWSVIGQLQFGSRILRRCNLLNPDQSKKHFTPCFPFLELVWDACIADAACLCQKPPTIVVPETVTILHNCDWTPKAEVIKFVG